MIELRQIHFSLKQVAFLNTRSTKRANQVYDALIEAAVGGIIDRGNVIVPAGGAKVYIDNIIDGDPAYEGVGPNAT